MEGVLQFLQSYGLWIALGGGLLFVMRRGGMGCCGMPQQHGAGQSRDTATPAGCHQQPEADEEVETAALASTAAELRQQLAELQAQQANLTQRIAALTGEPVGAGPADRHRTS